jgi:hypothetical protein
MRGHGDAAGAARPLCIQTILNRVLYRKLCTFYDVSTLYSSTSSVRSVVHVHVPCGLSLSGGLRSPLCLTQTDSLSRHERDFLVVSTRPHSPVTGHRVVRQLRSQQTAAVQTTAMQIAIYQQSSNLRPYLVAVLAWGRQTHVRTDYGTDATPHKPARQPAPDHLKHFTIPPQSSSTAAPTTVLTAIYRFGLLMGSCNAYATHMYHV